METTVFKECLTKANLEKHPSSSSFPLISLAESDIEKLENLMIELKELNVLRSADDRYFRFTRFTFFQMMGTSDEVDNKLQDYMEA